MSERLVAENLDNDHYIHHLIERLRWAALDAEDLEADVTEGNANEPGQARRRRATALG